MSLDPQNSATLELVADIVTAYVGNNTVAQSDLSDLIVKVHAALRGLSGNTAEAAPVEELKPAVPVKKSVTPDYIICLEDGRQFKSLKRHLQSAYGLTPDAYRAKWNLPRDYPMVAPNYAAARSELARSLGLGRKPAPEPAKKAAPARRKKA
ncbi:MULTISPECIES: MucR family transcriptional regulator [Azorhizobium]|uniref:Putative transcriptional regulator n=1 Tax=Azorhizobium caulinodans (strain ATCC 43989 / DSM 5975 / JCM 20966 / LMG 6465 / NBRC 14845 / NCIMB 13405 / ORS 571) TaxID=438753 RepID=A8I350_AZOC5|nr:MULTISPECIES: MucR family transcriptional regulator [Azorhizobium]TDT99183.1 MucR family transcriptional regulator [Azorhizobium sp. AG788]BAF87979.1 putative transcriptional regulator [Azorhizobium caulinodans ORS 571]